MEQVKAKELQSLKRLLGDWAADLIVMMPDGSTFTGKGTVRAKELSMDRGIHSEVRLDVSGMGAYHEDDL